MGTYAALRFLQDFPDGVLVVAVNNEYYLFCKESGVARMFKNNSGVTDMLCNLYGAPPECDRPFLLLHDLKSANGGTIFGFDDTLVTRVTEVFPNPVMMFMTSPQEKNYGAVLKIPGGGAGSVCFPTWSVEELVAAGYIEDQSDPKFRLCGGVPRSYLYEPEDLEGTMKSAEMRFNVEKMLIDELSAECSSKLVELVPEPTFRRLVGQVPVSQRAAEIISEKYGARLREIYRESIRRMPAAQSGHHLEQWTLLLLQNLHGAVDATIKLPLARLKDATTFAVEYRSRNFLDVAWLDGVSFDALFARIDEIGSQTPGKSVVLLPTRWNYPLFDAIVAHFEGRNAVTLDLFQCTVSSAHPASKKAARDFGTKFGEWCKKRKAAVELRIVFVGVSPKEGPYRGVETVQKVSGTKAPFHDAMKQYKCDVAGVEVALSKSDLH